MLDAGEYSSSSSAAVSVSVSAECFTKGNKCKNKRRFNHDQIKSMETMFENDTKLEPKMKLHLARELGLQPRQVAIWFQNKRARWKSKQLEKDYNLLHSNYNNLASQFQSLNKVKQSLLLQLQKLNDLIDKTEKEGHHDHECCRHEEAFCGPGSTMGHAASTDHNNGGSGNKINIIKSSGTTEFEDDVKPPILSSLVRPEYGVGVLSDDECSRNHDYLGFDKETQLPNPADSSLTSPEEWGRLDPDGMLDQPSSSYQWWDFWS